MSESRGTRQCGGIRFISLVVILLRLVKSKTTPAYAAVICSEEVNCFFLQIPASIEHSSIQQHLVEHCEVVCIGEKSGMPRYTSKQRRTLIVYITLHELPAEMLFFLRGHDLLG